MCNYSGNVQYIVCIRGKVLDGKCPCRARWDSTTDTYQRVGAHNQTTEWSEQKRDAVMNEVLEDIATNPTHRTRPKSAYDKAHIK